MFGTRRGPIVTPATLVTAANADGVTPATDPRVKILLNGLNYAPEPTGIGKFSGEMMAWLADRGHTCDVVTTPPYYPAWKMADGYSGRRYRTESIDGVNVVRCPLWVPRRVTGVKRLIHLMTFGLSGLPVVLWRSLRRRPDIVMTVEPALACAPGTYLAAKISGARCWLHVQDLEVDAAFELGLLENRMLRRLILAVERFWMRRFDVVSTISPNMMLRLAEKGVDESRMVAFPNWVDADVVHPINDAQADTTADPAIKRLKERFGIPADRFVVLYAGAIGAKQGLETVLDAAAITAGEPAIATRRVERQTVPAASAIASEDSPPPLHNPVHWVICGQGSYLPTLKSRIDSMDNVQWLPPQASEDFNDLMNCGDVHVLPQRSGAADLVMPSKLTGMMSVGRPIVAACDPGTQIADVLEGRGRVIPPGDADSLAAAVAELRSDPDLRSKYAAAARDYAVEELDRGAILRRFETAARRVVRSEARRRPR